MKPAPPANARDPNPPNSKLVVYPDSGHGGVFQHHQEFVPEVLAFLAASRAAHQWGQEGVVAVLGLPMWSTSAAVAGSGMYRSRTTTRSVRGCCCVAHCSGRNASGCR